MVSREHFWGCTKRTIKNDNKCASDTHLPSERVKVKRLTMATGEGRRAKEQQWPEDTSVNGSNGKQSRQRHSSQRGGRGRDGRGDASLSSAVALAPMRKCQGRQVHSSSTEHKKKPTLNNEHETTLSGTGKFEQFDCS